MIIDSDGIRVFIFIEKRIDIIQNYNELKGSCEYGYQEIPKRLFKEVEVIDGITMNLIFFEKNLNSIKYLMIIYNYWLLKKSL